MTFLIDLTEDRFKTPANWEIVEYIRLHNPFTHSDIGSESIRLGKRLSGARHYCPDFKACTYVVPHTERDLIFAIGLGMKHLAFRVPPDVFSEALTDGTAEQAEIGADWLCCAPFAPGGATAAVRTRLERWSEAAYRYAQDSAS